MAGIRINDDVIDFVMRTEMPPLEGELRSDWIERCRGDNRLIALLNNLSIADQLKIVVMRRSMRLSGETRKNEAAANPSTDPAQRGLGLDTNVF